MTEIQILMWDWKESINIKELNSAVFKFSKVTILEIDTGADHFAIAVGPRGMPQEMANQAYRAHFGVKEESL